MTQNSGRLSPLDSSAEILGFARDFTAAVEMGDVSSSERDGGGYALTSKFRENIHMGTISAPLELSQRSEHLLSRIHTDVPIQTPEIARNLEDALSVLQHAYIIANSRDCKLPAHHKEHVQQNLQSGLRYMQNVVEKVRNLTR